MCVQKKRTMKVKIVGFKCHVDSEYEFPMSNVTLLKGPSGSGKSTVLQAIFWCLYGGMRGVYNNGGECKKCSVKIDMGMTSIYRQKRPELLKLIEGDKVYEDKVAQAMIEKMFGSRDLWRTSSYIEQKSRCGLMNGSNAERMDILNKLSFNNEDPKACIERITVELKDNIRLFENKQAQFMVKLESFKENIKKRDIRKDVVATSDNVSMLMDNIDIYEKKVKCLKDEVIKQERLKGQYNMLKIQLSSAEKRLEEIPKTKLDIALLIDKIRDEKQVCEGLKSSIRLYEKRRQLEIEISRLEESLLSVKRILDEKYPDWKMLDISPTCEEIWRVKETEMLREKNMILCEKMGCEYEENFLKNARDELRKQVEKTLEIDRKVSIYNSYISHINQYRRLNINDADIETLAQLDVDEINQCRHLMELQKARDILKCPHCDRGVYIVRDVLVKGDRDPVTKEQITEAQNKYNNIRDKKELIKNAIKHRKEIDKLKKLLGDISEVERYIKSGNKIQNIANKLENISKIKFINNPELSSDLLTHINRFRKLESEICCKKAEMHKMPGGKIQNLPEASAKLNRTLESIRTHENQLDQFKKHEIRRKELTETINSYKKHLSNIILRPELNDEYENLKEKLTHLRILHDDTLYAIDMLDKQEHLSHLRSELLKLQENNISLERLKKNAIDVECQLLQETVDSINLAMEETLSLFFKEPITVTLQLYKTIKSKKLIKPGVNITIKYKGSSYDSVNQLSGGEGDRLSIALIMALNSISTSPFLLLDECMASFEHNIKESCLKMLKRCHNKTIICIDHGGSDGFYDHTISL